MLWSFKLRAGPHNRLMPNLATLLKSEIARVAGKQIRAETLALKKAMAGHRKDVAELKRRIRALEQELRLVKAGAPKTAPKAEIAAATHASMRFSAKGFAAHRKRLNLSAAHCGLLVGASGLSIYKWESGQSRPRAKYMPLIAAFRSLGKKDAALKLSSLR